MKSNEEICLGDLDAWIDHVQIGGVLGRGSEGVSMSELSVPGCAEEG